MDHYQCSKRTTRTGMSGDFSASRDKFVRDFAKVSRFRNQFKNQTLCRTALEDCLKEHDSESLAIWMDGWPEDRTLVALLEWRGKDVLCFAFQSVPTPCRRASLQRLGNSRFAWKVWTMDIHIGWGPTLLLFNNMKEKSNAWRSPRSSVL